MAIRFYVVVVVHTDGERLPVLLDAERQPVAWINAYIIQRLRTRLSFNSLVKVARILGYFWAWACDQPDRPENLGKPFSLQDRLVSGNGLTHDEIEGALYPWLRRNFRAQDKVRSLVVARDTVAFRLDVVSAFITWHLQRAMTSYPVGSPEIRDIQAKLRQSQRIFSDLGVGRRQAPVHAKPLADAALKRLFDVCEINNAENPWKKQYRQRNRLILLLMVTLGIRRGELLKLRVSDCFLSRSIPEIHIDRSPDDQDDPRRNEPQVKTESRKLPCDAALASQLNRYIVGERRKISGSDRSPFLFLVRTGRPMSLGRVNGIFDQIGIAHAEFSDIHPHALRSTCATNYRADGLRAGLEETRLDSDMMYWFGWRSEKSIEPYVNDAIRREACQIGRTYQASLFRNHIIRTDV